MEGEIDIRIMRLLGNSQDGIREHLVMLVLWGGLVDSFTFVFDRYADGLKLLLERGKIGTCACALLPEVHVGLQGRKV